jgi:beta-mannosidase
MFDDCWGEIGWTIVDYYLKRKISYYFVKRAFAPAKLILRESGGSIGVVGINETDSAISGEFEFGYTSFDGSFHDSRSVFLEMQPHSRKAILVFPTGSHDQTTGIYYVKPLFDTELLPATLHQGRFRDWKLQDPRLVVSRAERDGTDMSFTVSCSAYAHAVHFGMNDGVEMSDEYFDLLPGESRKITVFKAPSGVYFRAYSICAVPDGGVSDGSVPDGGVSE